MSKFANVILDAEQRNKPLTDNCAHCGTSRREMRLSDYKGCRFCRNSGIGSEPLGLEPREEKLAREKASRKRLEPARVAHVKWEQKLLRGAIKTLGERK